MCGRRTESEQGCIRKVSKRVDIASYRRTCHIGEVDGTGGQMSRS
jgi:hypothetical protein